ncbi:MAG: metal-dependent transcriptional regulator [Spirochaetes bacterium]|nr:metal-dependent transcriptional regulator [Spirochaetota bacterium]MBN2770792.1 metal-dependent transcriptional regulator [Spirochaetota bacterium]
MEKSCNQNHSKNEKHYYDTSLSANMEDYIETIALLSKKNRVVRVKDIARELNIKMPSVSAALQKLKELNLLDYEKYGFIELTDYGFKIAEKIYDKHSLIAGFLHDLLKLESNQSSEEACRLEHYLSAESCSQIYKLMQFYKNESAASSEWTIKLNSIMNCRTLINYTVGDKLRIIDQGEVNDSICPVGALCTIVDINNDCSVLSLSCNGKNMDIPFEAACTIYASYAETGL